MLSLDKVSAPQAPYFTRQWQSTVTLWLSLQDTYGTRTGNSLYEGLTNNDLKTLSTSLRLRDAYSV